VVSWKWLWWTWRQIIRSYNHWRVSKWMQQERRLYGYRLGHCKTVLVGWTLDYWELSYTWNTSSHHRQNVRHNPNRWYVLHGQSATTLRGLAAVAVQTTLRESGSRMNASLLCNTMNNRNSGFLYIWRNWIALLSGTRVLSDIKSYVCLFLVREHISRRRYHRSAWKFGRW